MDKYKKNVSGSSDCQKWMDEAKQIQQRFYETLGDRTFDLFEADQRWALETKIGFAVFGEPTEDSKVSKNGYSKKKNDEIKRICDLIYELQNGYPKVIIAFLFVIGEVEKMLFCLPVFKILSPNGNIYFLDQIGRVYCTWRDFKDNNKLPGALICFPKNGIYKADKNGLVLITFETAPSSRLGSKALSVLDAASTVVTVGATLVGIASMFVPVIAPITLAATVGATGGGIYGVARGSQQIHDRRTHKQSISLKDSTARNCWLSVFGSVFGIGSGLAIKGMVRMAASGQALSKLGMITVNILNYGSLTINGLGVANGLANLIEKKEKGELREVDILQFTTSVLFFTNAAMNAKTASNIIVEVKTDIFTNLRTNLSRGIENTFGKVFQGSGVEGTIQDFGQIIKGIRNVSSKDEFFSLLMGRQNCNSVAKPNDNGFLDGLSQIFPLKTLNGNVGKSGIQKSVDITQCLFTMEVSATLVVVEKVIKELGKKHIILANGVKLHLTFPIKRFFSELLSRYFPNKKGDCMESKCISGIILQSEKFAQENGCSTKEDYFDFTRFLVIYTNSLLNDMEKKYQASGLTEMDFDFENPILRSKIQDPVQRKKYFINDILESINKNNNKLNEIFKQYSAEVIALNNDGGLGFRSNYTALNEYYHSYVIDEYYRTPMEFFEVARKVANDKNCLINSKLDLVANNVCLTYSDKIVPVVVKVLKCKKQIFFESVSFKKI